MCVECDIIFNAQTDVINFVRHSYDGKIDLNNPLTKELAKNVCEFLCEIDVALIITVIYPQETKMGSVFSDY